MDTQVCCLHSQALIRLLLEKMKRIRKGSLHIWREVPFAQRDRKREKKAEDSDTNETTFQSNWHKRATSSLKTPQGSGTDIAPKVPLLFE